MSTARIARGQGILHEIVQMLQYAIIVDFQGTLHLSALQNLSVGTVESLGMLQANALMIQYATLVAKLAT